MLGLDMDLGGLLAGELELFQVSRLRGFVEPPLLRMLGYCCKCLPKGLSLFVGHKGLQ